MFLFSGEIKCNEFHISFQNSIKILTRLAEEEIRLCGTKIKNFKRKINCSDSQHRLL